MENTRIPERPRYSVLRTTSAERCGRGDPDRYTADDVLCPYFKRFRPLKICCEGITDDCTLQLSFKNRAAQDRQAGIFCIAAWKKCEIARILEDKYPE